MSGRAQDRFELRERLGQGAFGVVWSAFDRERRGLVALKQLRTLAPDALLRFKAEFRALQDLQHPNVVHFHELFEDEGRWFFTMELVEGVELLEWVGIDTRHRPKTAITQISTGRSLAHAEGTPPSIRRSSIPPLTVFAPDEERIRRAFVQLASALGGLHAEGLVHRDVKPSNVRVTPDGRVVLLDFGLVAPTAANEGAIVGTPAYMAPEQARASGVGAAADAYAFGVVLYEALTGRLPFAGTPIQILLRKQNEPPPRPRARVSTIAEDLDELVVALLDADPTRRPGLLDARRRLGVGSSRPATSPTPEPPFLGRHRELEAIRDAAREAHEGALRIVLVEGESGVGKSALVEAFTREAIESGAHVLHGRCYEHETVPYKAFDGVVDALAKLLVKLGDARVEPALPARAGFLPLVFPVLGQVPAIALTPPPLVDGMDGLQLRDAALGALRELFARLAERESLVLVVDDVQWSDEESLRVLDELAFGERPPGLLLLATVRPIDRECPPTVASALRSLVRSRGHRHLALRGLDAADARGLVEQLLQMGEGLGVDAEEIAAQAQGHPLFLAELVRHVQRSALRGRASKVDLDEALRERILDLTGPLRALLSSICLATRPLPREVVFELAGNDDAGDRAVKTLRVARLVRSARQGDEGTLEPFHDRVRAAVVAVLARSGRASQELVRVIERRRPRGREYSTHFRAAGERARAAAHALVAGRRAAQALAFHRAAQLLADTLELAPSDATLDRARIRVELADALRHAGRGAEAGALYESVLDQAPPDEARRLRLLATQTYLQSGRIDRGMRLAGEVLAEAGLALAGSRNASLAQMLYHRARLRMGGLEPSRSTPSTEAVARLDTVMTVGTVLSMVDFVRGAELQARALRMALSVGDRERFVRALATAGATTGCTEKPPMRRGELLLGRAEREVETLGGDPYLRAFVALSWGSAELAHYRFAKAHERAIEADALLREHCSAVPWELSTAHHLAGMTAWNLGRYRFLAQHVPRWVREARERSDLYGTTTITSSSAFALAIAEDRPDEGMDAVRSVMGEWAQPGFQIQHYFEMQSLTDLEIYAGKGALAHARQVRDWPAFRRSLLPTMPTMRFLMLSARARAALARARDDASARDALVNEAAKDLKSARGAMVQATNVAMADQIEAEVHAARGDDARAVALLERAIPALRTAQMLGFAAAASLRLGVLRQDDAEVQAAEAALRDLGVLAPRRYAWLRGPGVWA
ncbi:MAG: protein kinase [Polyangiales bacterium]